MPDILLTIVIPAYHGIEQLGKCLSALQNSQFQKFRTIVVDHGEMDDISRFVAADFPDAICLRGSPALWWSGATNIGIKYALENHSMSIMLLNHDCFVRPETIGNLVKSVELNSQTIIAPVQQNIRNGNITVTASSCFVLGFPTVIAPQWWQRQKLKSLLQETRLIIGGRGVIIPAGVLGEVGLFDQDRLPHYGADHDFYHRCRRRGINLLIDTSAFVDIDDSQTSRGNIDGRVTIRSSLQSLRNRDSHRNIIDVKALFEKHLAISILVPVSITLYIVRFVTVSFFLALFQKLSFKSE